MKTNSSLWPFFLSRDKGDILVVAVMGFITGFLEGKWFVAWRAVGLVSAPPDNGQECMAKLSLSCLVRSESDGWRRRIPGYYYWRCFLANLGVSKHMHAWVTYFICLILVWEFWFHSFYAKHQFLLHFGDISLCFLLPPPPLPSPFNLL